MKVVNDDGSIANQKWEINGRVFQVISTQSTGRRDSVWKALDTIKYPDGTYETMTRRQLKEKFEHL